MSTKKEPHDLAIVRLCRRRNNATMGILSTAAGAILMLTAFTAIPEPTLQLAIVSLGGWMIGGSR